MHKIDELVSREVYDKLIQYCQLLSKWNNTINLVSSKSIEDMLQRHVLDSLQLLKFIKNKDISIIDIGSGAGFPAIILSIAGISEVSLVESDSRKAAFLLQASVLSSGKVRIINSRIEDVKGLQCDIVTTRAFASLDKIFEYSNEITVRDKYLLHKGKIYAEEIAKAKKDWLFRVQVHGSISSDQGKILEITEISRR